MSFLLCVKQNRRSPGVIIHFIIHQQNVVLRIFLITNELKNLEPTYFQSLFSLTKLIDFDMPLTTLLACIQFQ